MEFIFYYYAPSGAAAGIFTALFCLSTMLHLYQLVRTRTWFMIPFAVGGILETIGYVGRILSSTQTPNWTKGPYIIQSALILIAPAFLAASIYMTLGRIIEMLHMQRYSIIPLRFLTKVFVAGDVLSFMMQASGAGIMVKDSSDPKTGEHIIVGGLWVQIIFFGLFIITAIIFELRISTNAISKSTAMSRVLRGHMNALYSTSALILVRSVVRVIEYMTGYDSYLMRHEVFIYVFDATLIFLAMVIPHLVHPSEINCHLGRGDKYSVWAIKTRKFMQPPTTVMEMAVNAA
ncbi:hypothetical protein CNMCM8694_008129 [Aspergillus lentulus]|nr:hypothetical protein CNMCM8060_003196 [Aspergillus lentulus]KAF4185086.1 hypothetical protein CNMCM7927_007111 [Aspergillus lentulus]KAF4198779.1 hypothetical protein CNMCM8694_008129 [Aspergillus lentulus]